MKKILSILIAFICINLCASTLEEKMKLNASKPKDLWMSFTQERTISLLEDVSISKGVLVFDKSGSVRWEINEPFRSVLISHKGEALQFEFIDGAWKKISSDSRVPLEKIVEQVRKISAGDFSEGAYNISEEEGKLILIPSNDGARKFIAKIAIMPNEDFTAAKTVEIFSPNGDKTLITFERTIPNPKNISDAFTTTPLKDYSPE